MNNKNIIDEIRQLVFESSEKQGGLSEQYYLQSWTGQTCFSAIRKIGC